MNMKRRIDRLEADSPENAMSVRVLFKREGEPDPVIDPPLQINEKALTVVFVDTEKRAATRVRAGMARESSGSRSTSGGRPDMGNS